MKKFLSVTWNNESCRCSRKGILFLAAPCVASYAGANLALVILGIDGQAYSNLIINTVLLLTSFCTIRLLGLSAHDVGLKIIRKRLAQHVGLSISIFTIYWLYYMYGMRISGLRSFSSDTTWGLLNYLVVAFAEEIYFRGLLYRIIEGKTSGRIAVLVSGLLFGLAHYRLGLGMLPKFFSGWLWGSVRYATGMIFLIVPIHFTYDAVWLLFQGNWDNPPVWAYLFPLVELLLAILIITRSKEKCLDAGAASSWFLENTQLGDSR